MSRYLDLIRTKETKETKKAQTNVPPLVSSNSFSSYSPAAPAGDLSSSNSFSSSPGAAERAYRSFVAELKGRPTEEPTTDADKACHVELLAAYRAAIREDLGAVEYACCTTRRPPAVCGHAWGTGHICGLGPEHHELKRWDAGHACACGAGNAGDQRSRPLEVREPGRLQPRPCPECGEVAFLWGPAGKPQRRCWGCDLVWTPGRVEVAS